MQTKILTDFEHKLGEAIAARGAAAPLTNREARLAQGMFAFTGHDAGTLGLEATSNLVSNALLRVSPNVVGGPPCNVQLVQSDIGQLRPQIAKDLDRYEFFLLNEENRNHYNQEQPFGQLVYDAFPSARYDATEAGNCLALERFSASVHHSMSALEPAMKALAIDVGAAVKDGMWKGVIDRIESKIEELKKTLPKGAARNDRLNFLSTAAKEFFYFKEGWRNWIAHAKVQYDREQALSALNHVGAFMRHLAARLHE